MNHRSLNFLIRTPAALDGEHPRGEALAGEIQSAVAARHAITQPLENWRDCGWEFCFAAEGEEFSLLLSDVEDDSTLLQISPRRRPNVLFRLLRQTPSATDAGLEARRREMDEILRRQKVVEVSVAYDGMPTS